MVRPVFDRVRLRRGLRRAGAAGGAAPFLRESSARLLERLAEIGRGHPSALALGVRDPGLAPALLGSGHADAVVAAALVPRLLPAASASVRPVVADEEALPFADASFDLVVSAAALHAVNDLPGALAQIRRALRPGGLFLASLPAGGTLRELREVLLEAEHAASGGAGLRVAPFADVRDLGDLLVRAGFEIPVADVDSERLPFPGLPSLLCALRAAGEGGALADGARRPLSRAALAEASRLYAERHGDGRGGILATVETVTLAGWAPGGPGYLRKTLGREGGAPSSS